jgi:hypothetical protein
MGLGIGGRSLIRSDHLFHLRPGDCSDHRVVSFQVITVLSVHQIKPRRINRAASYDAIQSLNVARCAIITLSKRERNNMGYSIRREFSPNRAAIVFEFDPQSEAELLRDFPSLRRIGDAAFESHRLSGSERGSGSVTSNAP